MIEELIGNVLVAQSGGPTSVINASLAGVISEALNYESIEEIYGALNGIEGILNEQLIDLASESQLTMKALKYTPGSALGTCRYKLKEQDLDRVLEVFQAHNIRYFFYIGGNDSQDTTNRIDAYAKSKGYKVNCIGIPKTVDNDLPITDHCPGYGSVIKFLSTTIRQLACDHESMGNHDLVSIVEVMGRNAGWIAAGTALAKRKGQAGDPPHIILLPEVPFDKDYFVRSVMECLKTNKYCMVVASEGIVDLDGNYVSSSNSDIDSFGHKQLGGAAEYLKSLVEDTLKVKARISRPGHTQRCASNVSSKADMQEAYMCGEEAVKAAVNGESGKMVALVRADNDKYACETLLVDLAEVANNEKLVPQSWVGEDKLSMNYQFIKYALPLVQGEVDFVYENGLPKFGYLAKIPVDQVLEQYSL